MMETGNRPLSPHVMIYNMPLAARMSILFRATGIALSFGGFFLAYWLISAAYGPEKFEIAQNFFGSWFGILCLLGLSACLWYHLANGVRHLIWDTTAMLTKEQLRSSGIFTIGLTAALTVLTWIIAFTAG